MKRLFSSASNLNPRTRLFAESLESREMLAGDVLPTVTITTNVGDITMEMRADSAPETVQNFLSYVNSDRYQNAFFHRLVPGFVLQGGGFTSDPAQLCTGVCNVDLVDPAQFDVIQTFDPVVNEFGISNTRGTVAMAKLGGDPDSATNQWFINLDDNSGNLDEQNGGFTVFAEVIDMTVADEIAAMPPGSLASIFPVTGERAALQAVSDAPLLIEENDTISIIRFESFSGEGVVQGTLRIDLNRDGQITSSDGAMAGYEVYLDEDNDGTQDSSEPVAVTDENGVYEFLADPGNHVVRAVSPNGFVEVESGAAAAELGAITTGFDLGQVYDGTSFHNPAQVTDVNAVGGIQPIDALLIINELELRQFSAATTGALNSISQALDTPLFIDVDNNSIINPTDVIQVINQLILQQNASAAAVPAAALSQGLPADSQDVSVVAISDNGPTEIKDLDLAPKVIAAPGESQAHIVTSELVVANSLDSSSVEDRTHVAKSSDASSTSASEFDSVDSVLANWP